MQIVLVFPHQLFVEPKDETVIVLIEDELFYNEVHRFHKQKLLLHRASMQAFYDTLDGSKRYFDYPVNRQALHRLLTEASSITAYHPHDHALIEKYQDYPIKWLEDPTFLTDSQTIENYFKARKNYYLYDFYRFQRKRLKILMNQDKPLENRYSFDTENRKKLPPSINIPNQQTNSRNPYVEEATAWVNHHFPNHPGQTEDFNYPITHRQAKAQLIDFVTTKLTMFGPYQDAISDRDPYLFHSNLSSSLNTGLILPKTVIDYVLAADVPLPSKEGFIRQIIGWREFVRAIYLREGKTMVKGNFMNHTYRLNNNWYQANTNLSIIDKLLQKIDRYAYSHHIERLMILGNFMFLMTIHPDDVYNYFMSSHIDAYAWVMVPNIYGMSQYANGPMMTTKPYFSGSNYLIKMGAEKDHWQLYWDALFYCFLEENKKLIDENPRLRVLLRNLERKSQTQMNNYRKLKQELIQQLTK